MNDSERETPGTVRSTCVAHFFAPDWAQVAQRALGALERTDRDLHATQLILTVPDGPAAITVARECFADRAFMRIVHKREQQAHCTGLRTRFLHRRDRLLQGRAIDWLENLGPVGDPLIELETALARNKGLWVINLKRVQMRPCLTTDALKFSTTISKS